MRDRAVTAVLIAPPGGVASDTSPNEQPTWQGLRPV